MLKIEKYQWHIIIQWNEICWVSKKKFWSNRARRLIKKFPNNLTILPCLYAISEFEYGIPFDFVFPSRYRFRQEPITFHPRYKYSHWKTVLVEWFAYQLGRQFYIHAPWLWRHVIRHRNVIWRPTWSAHCVTLPRLRDNTISNGECRPM